MWAVASFPKLTACRDSGREKVEEKWERESRRETTAVLHLDGGLHTQTHIRIALPEFLMIDFIDFHTQENIIVYKTD